MDSVVLWYVADLVQAMYTSFSRWIPVAALAAATANTAAQSLASVNGVYDSSTTPSNLPWNTYNYCNAPHVNAAHYTAPNVTGAKLVYLNAIIRHHKVCSHSSRFVSADPCQLLENPGQPVSTGERAQRHPMGMH